MTGPRKTGAQLTSSAASAQPQARRRLLPSCASSRGGPSAQHGLRHLSARRGKRLRSCACLHLPARPGSSGGRSVRSCGRRRTAAASKSHLVEVACELAALDPARGSKPGSNSRTRPAPRGRPCPTPEAPSSCSRQATRSTSGELNWEILEMLFLSRTRRVSSPKSGPSRRAPGARNGGIFSVLHTPPRLTGLECRTFNGNNTPRPPGAPAGGPSGLSRPGTP